MLERITFLLAVIGYAGLATTAVLAALGRFPRRLWRGVVLVIVVHVILVWVRYEGRFAEATRNGYLGFLVFHGALALIIASMFVVERRARVHVWAAFAIVSVGAVGAVSRYEVVAAYRAPVLLTAVAGAVGLARAYWLKRRRLNAPT
jgi:hypothetical protein